MSLLNIQPVLRIGQSFLHSGKRGKETALCTIKVFEYVDEITVSLKKVSLTNVHKSEFNKLLFSKIVSILISYFK